MTLQEVSVQEGADVIDDYKSFNDEYNDGHVDKGRTDNFISSAPGRWHRARWSRKMWTSSITTWKTTRLQLAGTTRLSRYP